MLDMTMDMADLTRQHTELAYQLDSAQTITEVEELLYEIQMVQNAMDAIADADLDMDADELEQIAAYNDAKNAFENSLDYDMYDNLNDYAYQP